MCPADIVQNNAPTVCNAVVNYATPAGSGSGTGMATTLTSGLPSGAAFPAGPTTVIYTVANNEGLSESCSFNVLVIDNEAPVFICPPDVTLTSSLGQCGAIYAFAPPAVSDNCGVASLTQIGGSPSDSLFPIGDTNIDFEAIDFAGNNALCRVVITVTDVTPPTITCLAPITAPANANCFATVNYVEPAGVDACIISNATLTGGLGSGAQFPLGTTTETYIVVDLAGNTAQCSFNITVVDNTPPAIVCPANMQLTIISDICDTLIVYPLPVATDNCSVPTLSFVSGITSGTETAAGFYITTFMATDAAGNSAACSFNITVIETIDPVIDCPGDITIPTSAGACEAIITFALPMATDVCTAVTVAQTGGPVSGGSLPPGSYPVSFTATDEFGNTDQCTYNILVADTTSPVFNCPADVINVSTDAGQCGAAVTYAAPMATDFCGTVSVVLTSGLGSGAFFGVGSNDEVYTAADLSGNESTCAITISVSDTEAPEIICPADIVLSNISTCSAPVVYGAPAATDNCAITSLTLLEGTNSGDDFQLGTTTITWLAADAAGNENTCTFTVFLSENEVPVFTCPDDLIVPTGPGVCSATVIFDDPPVADNCGVVSLVQTEGPTSGSILAPGTLTITFLAADLSGNEATCSFEITVADTEPPVIECGELITLSTDPGICGALYTFNLPNAADNCTSTPSVVQTQGPASGGLLPVGTTDFSFTATDEAGNTVVCNYPVLVVDDQAPVFTLCPDDISTEISDLSCEAEVLYGAPQATDNCDVEVSLVSGPASGSVLAPGVYTVQWQAVDINGNFSLCNFTIAITDTVPPVIVCPADLLICEDIGTFDLPTASDNCELNSLIQTFGPSSGSVFPFGESLITFVATDAGGNSATCSFTLTREQGAAAPLTEADKNSCAETSTAISANTPDFGTGIWSVFAGSGGIQNPGDNITNISGLGGDENILLWTIDPGNGCPAVSDTLIIIVESDASLTVGTAQSILAGGTAPLFAAVSPPGGELGWSPAASLSCDDCLDPVASPTESTTYYATYTTALGCALTDSVRISVLRELPNTITPNNDGVNDVWNIPEIGRYPTSEVYIYNRWGNEVFKSTGYRQPWDGSRNGELLPTGSYFYIIDYK